MHSRTVIAAFALAVGLHAATAHAQISAGGSQGFDATAVDLEELAKINVRTASVREQQLFRSPSAVYVMYSDEIRRSGARSIPQLLRLVPGLHVAQLDGYRWAVSARGFNGRYNNHLLVAVDGRTVYSPGSSGVRWEMEPVQLDDIERIEIVRGPGTVAWGENAVNGVVNILTKNAHLTQGWVATGGTANAQSSFGALRYSHKTASNRDFRLAGGYENQGAAQAAGDSSLTWNVANVSWKADLDLTPRSDLEFDGVLVDGSFGDRDARMQDGAPVAFPARARERRGAFLTRWEFNPTGDSAVSEIVLQFSADNARRRFGAAFEHSDVYDSQFRHRLTIARHHEVVWGAGHRTILMRRDGDLGIFNGEERDAVGIANVSVQDNIAIIPTKLTMRIGGRLSHQTGVGATIDPEIRASWSRTARQTLWAGVSQASGMPSLHDRSARASYPAPVGSIPGSAVQPVYGNPRFRPERVIAFEAGYRMEPVTTLLIDVSGYMNAYRQLQSEEPLADGLRLGNGVRGRTYGVEALGRWTPAKAWTLDGWISLLHVDLEGLASSGDLDPFSSVNSPARQWQVRSRFSPAPGWELDATAGYVGAIRTLSVPGYRRLEARIGRQLTEALDVSVVGQHLLDSAHVEFGTFQGTQAYEISRNVTGRIAWRF